MIVGIIGLGLIGGSLAISLKERGFASKIIGVDKNEEHCKTAIQLGFADETCKLDEVLIKANLVILAVPVDAARKILPTLLDNLNGKQVVIDMGSTKEGICKIADSHPNRKNFVASHPIAGTENAGPSAAFDGLYDNKITIICDEHKSDVSAVKLCKELYSTLKMKVLSMNAEEHDRHIAYLHQFKGWSGSRPSEVLKLLWVDVDLTQRFYIKRDTKSGKSPTFPMSAKSHSILQQQRELLDSCKL